MFPSSTVSMVCFSSCGSFVFRANIRALSFLLKNQYPTCLRCFERSLLERTSLAEKGRDLCCAKHQLQTGACGRSMQTSLQGISCVLSASIAEVDGSW